MFKLSSANASNLVTSEILLFGTELNPSVHKEIKMRNPGSKISIFFFTKTCTVGTHYSIVFSSFPNENFIKLPKGKAITDI